MTKEKKAMLEGKVIAVTRNGGYLEDAGQWSSEGKRAMQAIFDTGSHYAAVKKLSDEKDMQAALVLNKTNLIIVVPLHT